MAKYEETAQKANVKARAIVSQFPHENQAGIACDLVLLFNDGIRCGRTCHRTQRLNACRIMAKGLPVKVLLKTVKDERRGTTFPALDVEPIMDAPPVTMSS